MVKATRTQVVMADYATPGTIAYLEGQIKGARQDAIHSEISAVPFVERMSDLEKLNWPDALDGEPKTWERFCEERIGYPASYVADLHRGCLILKARGHRVHIPAGEAITAAQEMAADPDVKPLAPANTTGQHNRTVDNVNGRPDGNSASYIVRRLKRDHPEIAAALARSINRRRHRDARRGPPQRDGEAGSR